MSEHENGKLKEQPQPGQIPLQAQITPQGVTLNCAYPVTLGLSDEMMDSLCKQWILQRPALLQELAQRAVTAKKQELAIIKHINSHQRNN